MRQAHSYRRQSGQGGFTLLEVLIALVIFSVGLLGLAGLQMTGMRTNNGALLHTIAVQQTYDMAERIRSNTDGYKGGAYDDLSGEATTVNCSNASCSPANVARRDYAEWNQANAALLPSGQGTVSGDGLTFFITVMWDERRNGATGTDCDPDNPDDLRCVQLEFRP